MEKRYLTFLSWELRFLLFSLWITTFTYDMKTMFILSFLSGSRVRDIHLRPSSDRFSNVRFSKALWFTTFTEADGMSPRVILRPLETRLDDSCFSLALCIAVFSRTEDMIAHLHASNS